MNFNVYIDKQTGGQLERVAKARRTTRNALIREALSQFLQNNAKTHWPETVLGFEGIPGARRFENARRKLRVPAKDPFA